MNILFPPKVLDWIRKIPVIATILIVLGISFVPTVIHQRYYIFANFFLLGCFIITLVIKRARVFRREDAPLFIFLICSGINIFFAREFSVALQAYLNIITPLLCIYFIFGAGVVFTKEFNIVVKVICVASIIVGCAGILETFFKSNPLYEYLLPSEMFNRYITMPFAIRPLSIQGNPVVLGTYMLGSLAFVIALFETEKKRWRIIGLIGITVCVVVIIQTFSRGVFFGFISAVLTYCLLRRKYGLLLRLCLLITLLVSICSFLYYNENRNMQQLKQRNTLDNFDRNQYLEDSYRYDCQAYLYDYYRYSITNLFINQRSVFSKYRFERCKMTASMLKDHPLTGVGLNHFRLCFDDYYQGSSKNKFEFKIADNMYLTIAAETGLIGVFGFCIFFFSVFKKSVIVIRALNDRICDKAIFIALVSGLIGILVNMAAYELFYWPNQFVLLCVFLACIEGFYRSLDKKLVEE